MESTLQGMLPLAFGAAVSPTLLTLQLLILSSKQQPKARAWYFTGGAGVVLFGYILALTTIGQGLSSVSNHQTLIERSIKILAALALVYLGVRDIRNRHETRHPSSLQKHLVNASPEVFGPVGAGGMAANFSTLVLLIPAVHVVMRGDLAVGQAATLLVLLFLIAMLPVLVPVLAATVLGKKADPMLAAMNRFTIKHSAAINAGIAFFFAVLLGISAVRG